MEERTGGEGGGVGEDGEEGGGVGEERKGGEVDGWAGVVATTKLGARLVCGVVVDTAILLDSVAPLEPLLGETKDFEGLIESPS